MQESIVFCSTCTMSSYKESSRSLSHLLMSFLLFIYRKACSVFCTKMKQISGQVHTWSLSPSNSDEVLCFLTFNDKKLIRR